MPLLQISLMIIPPESRATLRVRPLTLLTTSQINADLTCHWLFNSTGSTCHGAAIAFIRSL